METETPDVLDVDSVVQSTAWNVARNNIGNVTQDDLAQEGWCWILEHPIKMKKHRENESPRQAAYELGRDIWGVMDRYARREKAARGGYAPEDDLFISDTVIALVLPSVLKGDPTPPVRDGERVANTADPAEGGNWLATFLDVKRAWETADLTGPQRDLAVSYYRDGIIQSEIANALGIGQQAVAKRLSKVRDKLIAKLGGRQAPPDEPEVSAHPGAKTTDDATKAAIR
jgi:DNA-directed RNA polymerase specialized sigma24 family protein